MLTCREVAGQATEHLEGHHSFAQRIGFRLHLALCRPCRAFVEQIRHTARALRGLPAEPPSTHTRDVLIGHFRQWKEADASPSRSRKQAGP